ncbi:CBF/Mak21 family domain-containing protein [Phthorimaea operculella]|nr:CBF/Mak21 family domain-containing protein [Phthorimaea operculella]
MKHKRFEENILVDEAYTNYGKIDKNEDQKKGHGIAKHFAETLEYGERKKWFEQIPEEPSTITKTLTHEQIEELKKEANSALHGDTLAYETKQNRSGSSDHQWAKTLLNKGAIGDRVAAATILIQDNPLYNLTALRNLINNVKPAKKKDGIIIIDALSELLISELLIPDAKLRTFDQHALGHVDDMSSGNKQTRRNILKLWHFEDQLKELYGTYVEALSKFAQDSVEANREKAVSAMSYLLMHHPEREKMLLTSIINKLGDPSTSVASKVIYHLCQLLYNHPNMKSVVLAEIEKMLFRTNIAPRAQYYGICFLNQFFLGKDDSRVAENLIRIYFSFFKASIKKGAIDTRLMSAILTGVKRAFPFADKDRLADTPAHIDAIHKLVNTYTIYRYIHKLVIYIHDISIYRYILTGVKRAFPFADKDRLADTPAHIDAIHKLVIYIHDISIYRYILTGVKRAFPFADKDRLADTPAHIDAIHKLDRLADTPAHIDAIHKLVIYIHDISIYRYILTGVKRAFPFADKDRLADTPAHIDAIHKLVHLAPLNTAIHALALLFQICSANKHTNDRYYTALYRKLTSPEIFNTTHSALLFSLIFKSLKQDKDVARLAAFIKRLLQLPPAQAAGLLLLISQLLKPAANQPANLIVWTPVKQLCVDSPPAQAAGLLLLISQLLKPAANQPANLIVWTPVKQLCVDSPPAQAAGLLLLISQLLKPAANQPANLIVWTPAKQLCVDSPPAQAAGLLLLISQLLKPAANQPANLIVWTPVKQEVKEETEVSEKKEESAEGEDSESKAEHNGTVDATEAVKEEQKKIDLLRGDKKDLLMDDEEESYVDLKIDEEGNIKPKRRPPVRAVAGWYHAKVNGEQHEEVDEKDEKDKELESKIKLKKTINMDRVITEYNHLARNPSFAGAQHSAYFELTLLVNHFHPTVKLFAEKLLNGQIIQYSGDPLKDFAGVRFLDRFVFKNPKKRAERGADEEDGVKKVKGSHPRFALRKNYTAKGLKSLPVNSASYLNEDAKKIPVDERFLYDFLQKRRSTKDSDDDSDNDSVTSEDFDKYLDTVTGATDAAELDDDLDYLAELETSKQKRPTQPADDDQIPSDADDEQLDDDDDDAGDDGDSDGGLDISGDEDEPQLSGDEDELLLQDSEDDDDDMIDVPGKGGKRKPKLNLKGGDDLGSLFASAEEFSTLLEETATNKKQGSSQAVSNTDNASTKQLAWEENRDKWIKGYNKKIHGHKSKKAGKKFSKPGNTKFNKMAAGYQGGKRKSASNDIAGGKKRKFK